MVNNNVCLKGQTRTTIRRKRPNSESLGGAASREIYRNLTFMMRI